MSNSIVRALLLATAFALAGCGGGGSGVGSTPPPPAPPPPPPPPPGPAIVLGATTSQQFAVRGASLPFEGDQTPRLGADEQGRLQGAIGSLQGIASMVAPLLFTQLFAAAVGPYRAWNLPGIPFLVAGLLLVWALAIARRAAAQPAAPVAAVE